jgi:hypothetical protein
LLPSSVWRPWLVHATPPEFIQESPILFAPIVKGFAVPPPAVFWTDPSGKVTPLAPITVGVVVPALTDSGVDTVVPLSQTDEEDDDVVAVAAFGRHGTV